MSDSGAKVLIQNSNDSKIYNVSELCGPITVTNSLSGHPGKLTATFQRDPNEILSISSGSRVDFVWNGKGVFFGYVFIHGTDRTETYKITAYDQIRYLQNKEVYYTESMTADQIFEVICSQNQLPHKVYDRSSYVVPSHMHDNVSLYSIVAYGIQQTLINTSPKKMYFVRDEYGTLAFRDMSTRLTQLILGDESLLTDYRYEVSIDKETANEIKVVRNDEDVGKRFVWIKPDTDNQKRWGVLRHLEVANDNLTKAQIIELAENLLRDKNRESKTMKLNAIGYPGINSGDGIRLELSALGIKQNLWVSSATHNYSKDLHTMSLEVFI